VKFNILILLFTINVCSQQTEKPYPTQFENEIWMNKFRTLNSDTEKISEIKNKIFSDTLFYNYKKNIMFHNSRDSKKHICKALINVNFKNHYYDLDLLANPNLSKIMNYLNLKNIVSITILEKPENTIHFGSQGICGVIIMKCNRKLYRKIKNVL
jgi:hypothetical protein